MSLFIRKETLKETYPKELDFIWEKICDIGTPLFYRKDLEEYWRDFSDEVYAAGFMNPDLNNIEEFINWLEEK